MDDYFIWHNRLSNTNNYRLVEGSITTSTGSYSLTSRRGCIDSSTDGYTVV